MTDEDKGLLDSVSSIKDEFREAVLNGDEFDTGLAMSFKNYANLMDKNVGDAYDAFAEDQPQAKSGYDNPVFNRFSDDMKLLVDAEIIEPLEMTVAFRAREPKFKKRQPLIATEHGEFVISQYLRKHSR